MPSKINLIGNKYSLLEVIAEAPSKNKRTYWECLCKCGNTTTVRADQLKSGKTKSCGCLLIKSATKHGHNSPKTKTISATYQSWKSMKQRCNNPNYPHYKNHGGRGITYDPSWEDFENFLADMGECPPGLSIERVDNNGNYEPNNCIWATFKQQANNKRSNRNITYQGRTQTLNQWAEEIGMPKSTLLSRLNSGWSVADALTRPVDISKRKKAANICDIRAVSICASHSRLEERCDKRTAA